MSYFLRERTQNSLKLHTKYTISIFCKRPLKLREFREIRRNTVEICIKEVENSQEFAKSGMMQR